MPHKLPTIREMHETLETPFQHYLLSVTPKPVDTSNATPLGKKKKKKNASVLKAYGSAHNTLEENRT